jgi:hemerythrin-like domain-containing protein
MKNVTHELSVEHQHILHVIEIVLNECSQVEKGDAVNTEFFHSVIGFIKNYADGYHHAKEEDILFKAMLENLENMHCNPIPVMLHEHDAGREFVKKMVESLDNNDTEALIQNARGYCFLLQNHIYKEDNVLYPMAEQSMTDSKKQEVENQYKSVRIDDFLGQDIELFIESLTQKVSH